MDGWNYFNYFTEIEEYFWKKRGAHLLVSPLDWAIMEAWQKAGVPLEAVLKGIDRAFDSYGRFRRGAGKPLKSLAYCTDTLLEAPGTLDLEDLERRFTVLDEKTQALLISHAPEDLMLKIRRELDGQLATYRRKMKAAQLALVEKQYVQKRLLEEFALPRLSLFYLLDFDTAGGQRSGEEVPH